MLIKLCLFLIFYVFIDVEGFMLRGNGIQFQYHSYSILHPTDVKLSAIGNMLAVTCTENSTLARLPKSFITQNIINHIKFNDCFHNKSNLINYTTQNNNNYFNLNQFIIKHNLKINSIQLTVEFDELSEISVEHFFDNFKFNSFNEIRLVNLNFLNQTLLSLFTTTTKLNLLNNYQINLNYLKAENSLELLIVRNNIVKNFKLEQFKNLLSLELVDCDINLSEFNVRNFFEMNTRLVSLHMERNFDANERIDLNDNVFKGLRKLKFLKFSRENLHELPVGIFRDLASLIQLNLAHNRLEYLPKEILYNNELLEAIDLSNNNLKEITDVQFIKTPYLMHINLGYNQLETIQYNASLQNSIQMMNLNHNNIKFDNSSVCPIITAPSQYLQINLAYNKIENIKSIECLINDHSIQKLNVSGNLLTELNITRLVTDTMLHKSMSQLILSDNQISKVDLFETFDWNSYEVVHGFSNLIVDLDENPVLCSNCSLLKNMFAQDYFNVNYRDMVIRFVHPHYCKITSYCDVEQYYQFVYHCPVGCSCNYNEFILNFRVNCSNANLTEVPEIPYPSFIFSEIELILDNNMITNFTLDNQYYDVSYKITRISLKNNSLVDFALPHNKYPLHLLELNLYQNNLESFSNETLAILNIAQAGLNVTLGANRFCANQTYYNEFIKSYRFNLVDDISCPSEVETLVIAPHQNIKITISNLAILLITLISIVAIIGVIGVMLLFNTKRQVLFLRRTFVNHKRLDEGVADLGEELLGEDEM